MMAARPDVLWAVVVGGVALAIYLRTLAPGLVAVVDTPMFQFIGRVLGVPHNPGYPLYVFLTFPFSYLPIGSLPYRINLFSAILAALTVSLTFLIARHLGCRRIVGAAAALGMAFGHIFWSQAIIAEVYTLNSAILAGVLLALLHWSHTGRHGFFFLAVALFAAGLGNHTTIVGFAPGIALYALLTHRQFVLRARTLAITTLILLAGLLQYGFVIVRSRQPGAYVESRATTVGELFGVVSGRQFSDRLFVFEWREVISDRLPWLVGRILAPELTFAGLALGILGAAWLLRHRLADAILILLGGFAAAGFALNYSVSDTPVFLIPTTFVLWVAAAVGTEQSARFVERRRGAAMAVAIAITMLVLPAWQLARNFAVTDRSHDTAAAVTLDSLFEAVPDRSALVHEDFLVDRMVTYKLIGDGSAKGRQIKLVPRNANVLKKQYEAGVKVFGFQKSVRQLRYDALNFGFGPLPLIDGTLEEVLSRLPDGTVVAFAVPAAHSDELGAAGGISFAAIGGPGGLTQSARASLVIVGVTGASRGAVVETSAAETTVRIGAGEEIGGTGVRAPEAIEVRADDVESAVRQGSRDLVRTLEGAVIAMWNDKGGLKQSGVLQAADAFRVPLPMNSLSIFPLQGIWASRELARDRWTDVASTTDTGSIMLRVPAASSVVVYLGSVSPLAPRVVDQSSTRSTVEITPFQGSGRETLPAKLEADNLKNSSVPQAPFVYRITVGAPRGEAASVLTALGGVPQQAVGRVVSGRSTAAAVFRVDTMGLLRTPDRASEVLLMARDDQAQLTGDGWSSVDWDSVSTYRWMTKTQAHIMLPVAKPDAQRIRIQAFLEKGGAPQTVALRLNGIDLPFQPLRSGWNAYEWMPPKESLRPIANDVVISVDQLSPPKAASPARGLAVTEVRVIHGS
jgi:Protein O-mannosyl-transferase TMEM260-like